jgi:hypothetical protein
LALSAACAIAVVIFTLCLALPGSQELTKWSGREFSRINFAKTLIRWIPGSLIRLITAMGGFLTAAHALGIRSQQIKTGTSVRKRSRMLSDTLILRKEIWNRAQESFIHPVCGDACDCLRNAKG